MAPSSSSPNPCHLGVSSPGTQMDRENKKQSDLGPFERKSVPQNKVWGKHFSPCKTTSCHWESAQANRSDSSHSPSPHPVFIPTRSWEKESVSPASNWWNNLTKVTASKSEIDSSSVEYLWPCEFLAIARVDTIISIFRWGNWASVFKLICSRSHRKQCGREGGFECWPTWLQRPALFLLANCHLVI